MIFHSYDSYVNVYQRLPPPPKKKKVCPGKRPQCGGTARIMYCDVDDGDDAVNDDDVVDHDDDVDDDDDDDDDDDVDVDDDDGGDDDGGGDGDEDEVVIGDDGGDVDIEYRWFWDTFDKTNFQSILI